MSQNQTLKILSATLVFTLHLQHPKASETLPYVQQAKSKSIACQNLALVMDNPEQHELYRKFVLFGIDVSKSDWETRYLQEIDLNNSQQLAIVGAGGLTLSGIAYSASQLVKASASTLAKEIVPIAEKVDGLEAMKLVPQNLIYELNSENNPLRVRQKKVANALNETRDTIVKNFGNHYTDNAEILMLKENSLSNELSAIFTEGERQNLLIKGAQRNIVEISKEISAKNKLIAQAKSTILKSEKLASHLKMSSLVGIISVGFDLMKGPKYAIQVFLELGTRKAHVNHFLPDWLVNPEGYLEGLANTKIPLPLAERCEMLESSNDLKGYYKSASTAVRNIIAADTAKTGGRFDLVPKIEGFQGSLLDVTNPTKALQPPNQKQRPAAVRQ